jgi:hypothetical protein
MTAALAPCHCATATLYQYQDEGGIVLCTRHALEICTLHTTKPSLIEIDPETISRYGLECYCCKLEP